MKDVISRENELINEVLNIPFEPSCVSCYPCVALRYTYRFPRSTPHSSETVGAIELLNSLCLHL